MEETHQPKTSYLVLLFFFTLTVATRTTAYVNCQTSSLYYPFGFSNGYPIRFNCSTNGSAEIGEFSVQRVTDDSIYVEIPLSCNREFRKIEQLFQENFAPSYKNSILAVGCNEYNESLFSGCSISGIFGTCKSMMNCSGGGATTVDTADVMSIGDVNRSGCKYWVNSVTFESMSTVESISGELRLDWWLKEGCSNTTCSENESCTQVKLPNHKLGHRCTCLDGFGGDPFTMRGGCRLADENHEPCSVPFSCGDQKDLSYPFWVSGREECGHPDFKLQCNGGFAKLNISSVTFRILEVTNNSRIIRLARSDYISNLCLQNPLSAPFNQNVLSFSPDTEMLTIYYDCPFIQQPVSTYVGDFACENDSLQSYYVTRNLSSPLLNGIGDFLSVLRGMCKGSVSIPSSGPALKALQNNRTRESLKKALEEGFELRVNQECVMCIESGGVCGYNQTESRLLCHCSSGSHNRTCSSKYKGTISFSFTIGIVIASAMVVGLVVAGGMFCYISRRRKILNNSKQQNPRDLIPLKHYSYAQIKKITKSFAEKVGKGGFGTVYREILCDGRSVAVKVLKDSKGHSEDFINEVASMSKTSHVNIVDLLGFCSEGSKRAILYEFMENGSLDMFISRDNSTTLDWRTLYNISLGVARGLEYLHHGCKARIIHFDIKPQNVLLDDNLCPKVSDFGLAKLCENKESIMSLLDTRGTIGYIAPEVFSRMYGRVSHKSDVYSYGMLVLEMIGARDKEKATQNYSASSTSSMYFPEWIYKDLEKKDTGRIIENRISSKEEEIEKKMTVVGLWCIQSSPSNRPPMNRVVEMMEGSLDALEVPPRPVLQQIPAAPLSKSLYMSEGSSSASNLLICSTN